MYFTKTCFHILNESTSQRVAIHSLTKEEKSIMLKPNNVTLPQTSVFKDAKVRAIGVQPSYEYADGKVTDKRIGTTYQCLAEKNSYEKLSVKVGDLNPIFTQEQIETSDEAIYITFDEFEGKFYFNTRMQDWALSCKAKSVKLVNKK